MQKYFNYYLDDRGEPIRSGSVLVQTSAGASATIYDENGNTATNPITTSTTGYFEFYAPNGRYTLYLSKSGHTATTIENVLLDDPTVATIAALRAAGTPTTSNTRINVLGYTTAGDGGGGDFYWDSSSSDADDGGITILPTGYAGVGRWKRSHDGTVTDKCFGVVRDDSTDDGAALAAFIAAQKVGGWTGVFTAGTAVSNQELTIDTANASFVGPGNDLSFIRIGSSFTASNTLLTVNDCGRTAGVGTGEQPYQTGSERRCVLKGFGLKGNGRALRAHGLYFSGLNDDAEVDLSVYDFKGHGVAFGKSAGADTMRESKINLHVKNCGDNRDINDFAAVHIGGIDSTDGHNNLWFNVLRIVYPRGVGFRVYPDNNTASGRTRKINISNLFLHGNAQLPASTDPQGESWYNTCNLMEIGKSGASTNEVATINVYAFFGIGLESGYRYAKVVGGSALHILAYNFAVASGSYGIEFAGAQASSVRNYIREVDQQPSNANSAANLIKVTSMEGAQHTVSVSGIGGTTITSGQPGYTGALASLNDEDAKFCQIYKPQDSAAGTAFPVITLMIAQKVMYVQRLTIVPNSALTANDVDYATIEFVKISSGGGVGASLGSITTKTGASGGSGDWVAYTPVEITVSGSRIDSGEGIAVRITKSGAGVVVPHSGVIAVLSPNLSVV